MDKSENRFYREKPAKPDGLVTYAQSLEAKNEQLRSALEGLVGWAERMRETYPVTRTEGRYLLVAKEALGVDK